MSTTPLVFISYSHRDSEFVNRLAALLISYDLNVWKDSKDLPIGGNIPKNIYHGIKSSSHFCCIISEASVESQWVEEELSFAKMRQLDNRELMIVPILISDVEVPDYVKVYRYANLQDRNLSPTNPEVGRMMRAFGVALSGRLTHVILGPAREKLLIACKELSVSLWNFRDHVLVFEKIKKGRDDSVRNHAETLASDTSYGYLDPARSSSAFFGAGYNRAPTFGPDRSESLRKYTAEQDREMHRIHASVWSELKGYAQRVLDSIPPVEIAATTGGVRLLDEQSLNSEQFQTWRELGDVVGNLHSLCGIVVEASTSEVDYISGKAGYFSGAQKVVDNVISLLESWAALERATL
jgi:hypothetical protein